MRTFLAFALVAATCAMPVALPTFAADITSNEVYDMFYKPKGSRRHKLNAPATLVPTDAASFEQTLKVWKTHAVELGRLTLGGPVPDAAVVGEHARTKGATHALWYLDARGEVIVVYLRDCDQVRC